MFVTDCDVAAAVDHVTHHLIIDATEALKVSPVLVAAWIREYRGPETHIKLDDILTPGLRRTRSVPQGDPCAANLFMAALYVPATVSCKRCQAEKWGLPVGGHHVALLLFADNCWLTALSPAELRCVGRAWNELLVRAGLRIAWKDAVWCTSAPDSLEANIEVDDTEITRTAREQGFKALGAWISCATTKVALRHRLRLLSACAT